MKLNKLIFPLTIAAASMHAADQAVAQEEALAARMLEAMTPLQIFRKAGVLTTNEKGRVVHNNIPVIGICISCQNCPKDVEELLECQPERDRINDLDDPQGTPLLHAAMAGRLEIAQMLLKHGANPEIANADGRTPLEAAVGSVNPELCLMLADKVTNSALISKAIDIANFLLKNPKILRETPMNKTKSEATLSDDALRQNMLTIITGLTARKGKLTVPEDRQQTFEEFRHLTDDLKSALSEKPKPRKRRPARKKRQQPQPNAAPAPSAAQPAFVEGTMRLINLKTGKVSIINFPR